MPWRRASEKVVVKGTGGARGTGIQHSPLYPRVAQRSTAHFGGGRGERNFELLLKGQRMRGARAPWSGGRPATVAPCLTGRAPRTARPAPIVACGSWQAVTGPNIALAGCAISIPPTNLDLRLVRAALSASCDSSDRQCAAWQNRHRGRDRLRNGPGCHELNSDSGRPRNNHFDVMHHDDKDPSEQQS
jgi:hypothetical protein